MGLDAFVRCCCFEEHKLIDPPVPYDDLYIDAGGMLSSKKLDEADKRLTYRQFMARYGEMDDRFRRWLDHPCEHEYGEYCSEWVANIAGVIMFEDLVEEFGGSEVYPLLSKMLPSSNDGFYPIDLALPTLGELDRFIASLPKVDTYVLGDVGAREIVWRGEEDSDHVFFASNELQIGFKRGKVYFKTPSGVYFETARFRQMALANSEFADDSMVLVRCLDSDKCFIVHGGIPAEDGEIRTREFVVEKEFHLLDHGTCGIAERLRHLLVASIETGNPIVWC